MTVIATTNDEHPLYKAGVHFLVSKKTDQEAWALVAKWGSFFGNDVVAMESEFATIEKQLKADFNITSMPTAWRSSKSTIINAARQGVAWVEIDGSVVPKTEVYRRTKLATPVATQPEIATIIDSLNHALSLITRSSSLIKSDAHVIRTLCVHIETELKGKGF